MRGRAGKPAFTLLEVVLAVALSLGLVVAMLTFYKQTADVRAAVLEEAQLIGAERVIMDLVTDELRAAMVYPFLGQGMDGQIGDMRFATVTVPTGGVWIVQKVTEVDQVPPEADLQVVGYRLRVVEDEQGFPVVAGLERTCQKTMAVRAAEEGEDIQATLLAPEIQFLRLRYWDGSTWIESWSSGDLPQAVEVVLGREPLPERLEPLEYPYPTFRRVIYVPSAAKPATGGTVVRGLGGEGGGP